MAQVNNSSLGGGSPSASAAFGRIRNSCHACALSKLKCPQQKPTCSRCAKRGITCEYHVAKQGGRKPNNSRGSSDKRKSAGPGTQVTASHNSHLPSQADGFGSYSLHSSSNALQSPEAIPTSSRADFSQSMSTLEDFFRPMYQPLSASSTETGMDLDEFLSSPVAFSDEEMAINLGNPCNFPPTAFDGNSPGSESFYGPFPVLNGAAPNPSSFYPSSPSTYPTPSPEMQRIAPVGGGAHNYEEVSATGSSCGCLVQALAIMRNLISTPADPYKSFTDQNVDNATALTAWTVQAVFGRNQTSIEAVGTMLQCSCSQDAYLLAVMALIIFKVMGWYTTVARETPCGQGSCAHLQSPYSAGQEQAYHSQTNVVGGGCCLECANSARMVAQMIMNELQRVGYLVEQLSSKLKVQAAKKGGRGGGQREQGSGVAPPGGWDWDNEMTLPLSTTMYDQMDADLKKRLSELSSEMMDRLRRV